MKAKTKRASRGSPRTSRSPRQGATKKENKWQATSAVDARAPGNVSQAIEAVRGGDAQRFDTIFDFLHDRLRNYVRALQRGPLSGGHGVSDTVSETLLKLYKAIVARADNPVQNRDQLTGLALFIARGTNTDEVRRSTALCRGGKAKSAEPAESLTAKTKEPWELLIAHEMAGELQRLIANETDEFTRRLLELSLLEGCSHDEIRTRLRISANKTGDAALARRIQRANRKILDALRKKFPEE